jgi:hypothetical protein
MSSWEEERRARGEWVSFAVQVRAKDWRAQYLHDWDPVSPRYLDSRKVDELYVLNLASAIADAERTPHWD